MRRKVTVPLVRELSMLALGSAGMFRELFLVRAAELSMVRVTISALLMMGPAAVWVWWRAKLPSEPGSPSPVSPLPPPG